ncbi:MAG: FkbM family methyltransferase [Microcoleaceae cyanobacterium]
MEYKPLLGKMVFGFLNTALSSELVPLNNIFPKGISHMYDLKRKLKSYPRPVIFDVGANIGQSSILFNRYFPQSEIYAFEPIQETYKILHSKTKHLESVRVLNHALGSESGEKKIRLLSNSLTNTLVDVEQEEMYHSPPTDNYETIKIETIDDFCKIHSIINIDVLKMDVEGYEIEVLQGAKNRLSQNLIKFIYSEVSFSKNIQVQQDFGELNEFLSSYSFELYGFYELCRYRDSRAGIKHCNALFVHKSL